MERVGRKRGEIVHLPTDDGPLWLVQLEARTVAHAHHDLFKVSEYGVARDLAAQVVSPLLEQTISEVKVEFVAATDDEQCGALVGLELGAYRYRLIRQPRGTAELPRISVQGVKTETLEAAQHLGNSLNFARHLVNVPAAELNPKSYADLLEEIFAASQSMQVDVWGAARLKKERMGLLLGVGQAATEGPALVHLKYRPKGVKKSVRPIAFVGKGITFDTGGLDIKVSSGMRLMKKDMGGSASLAGLALWLERSQLPVPCDIYLALAENAVDQTSVRPGDVLLSRSGLTVEIDNTDAEGRLVLADAIDVAVKAQGDDKPELLINLATLTGAMRIALGTRVAGMFANNDALAESLLKAAKRAADPTWRMPLFGDYFSALKTPVADMANSGHSRFGGPIVAALFLQRFIGDVPWAHFDMYAWSEGNTGGCIEAGGTGQCLQLLTEFLRSRVQA
ncbi:MAG: leucyl aminopeptidase family protein [Deltaproteobacteria bacterium]|nr:leucyl aminopeptidase family protein [Deltaproteobacteria bacterium]